MTQKHYVFLQERVFIRKCPWTSRLLLRNTSEKFLPENRIFFGSMNDKIKKNKVLKRLCPRKDRMETWKEVLSTLLQICQKARYNIVQCRKKVKIGLSETFLSLELFLWTRGMQF